MREHMNPAPCEVMLDLDCDDSNSIIVYDCLNADGVAIVDTDISLFADDWLDEMTITISPIPDAPDEILTMLGSIPNIDVTGASTSEIALINAGGATINDFKEALQLVRYQNISLNPTGGLRTISVQFTTAAGTTSNPSEFYIEVVAIPTIPLDLGADIELCEGESITLDANYPNATYVWSTGAGTQTILVEESGVYAVTVSDGINCPNRDTVVVDIIPVISVSLTGDTDICDNETANLILNTTTPFSLDIEITADPGSLFSFPDVTGSFPFIDLPTTSTTYTITSVVPSQPACIELPDSSQLIEVYPSYVQDVQVSLCDGDSIWLGYYWETAGGFYEVFLETENGCDSTVNMEITILPAEHIAVQTTTCDPSAAGVFITFLDNPNGCDTVVETTVTLLLSDTTNILRTSCNSDSIGVSTIVLSNQAGCDSLIITTVTLIPPADTTWLTGTTCDSSILGSFEYRLTDQTGCDSLVITTIHMAPADTTYLHGVSCDTAAIGETASMFTNQAGCDSLVITTIIAGIPDTTYLSTTSCDSSSLGVFETNFISTLGCDSTVFTTVNYSASDSTFINGADCDPTQTGVTIQQLINRFGCDSIVTTSISLLPSDMISIGSTTCDPSEAGVFIYPLTNQFGCDSIVTETITLLPSDETFLTGTTCLSSEAGIFITSHFNQYGCDSIATLTVDLILGDTTPITYNTCDAAEVGIIETLYTGHDGCDSMVIETTLLYPLPELSLQSTHDYNGYDVSCEGGSDGSVLADVNGVPPYTFLWSTGDTDEMITGLSAGDYSVNITDGNGCMTIGVITLTEPDALMIGFEIAEPGCFDQQLGSITVAPIGGVAPYTYSINGGAFQTSPTFTGLSEGVYQITTLDANQCETKEIISIKVPLQVHVQLGDDQVISLGDSAQLQAVINLPFDSLASIIWTGTDTTDCANCLTQIVTPIITTAYSVSITSVDGCTDADSLTVFVAADRDLYIPNIFSPNGDGINDVLTISTGDAVDEIELFSIFDRWGNMVFQANHILPDDTSLSWDGKMNGETMNPAVFTYKMIVRYGDGLSEVRYGDVTLVR